MNWADPRCWFELNRIKLNCTVLKWIELIQVKMQWIQLNLSEWSPGLGWAELNPVGFNQGVESKWSELLELDWIAMDVDQTDLNQIVFNLVTDISWI